MFRNSILLIFYEISIVLSGTSFDSIKEYYFMETFNQDNFNERWIYSRSKKSDNKTEYDGKFILIDSDSSFGKRLITKNDNSYYAVLAQIPKKINFDSDHLIISYQALIPENHQCGGAYIKLISDENFVANLFNDKTLFTIMFGPDKCGNNVKFHFIYQHKNRSGEFEEKHLNILNQSDFDFIFSDNKLHTYKLILSKNNQFKIFIDSKLLINGSLFEGFQPPLIPSQFIDDPNHTKPADWDDQKFILDPNAVIPDELKDKQEPYIPDPKATKPKDWFENEEELIIDETDSKPLDWNDQLDGEWEPKLMKNPKCKNNNCGKWVPPMINNPHYRKWEHPLIRNPNYKGPFKPRQIKNPDFYDIKHPYKMKPISAIALELLEATKGIQFDNIFITYDLKESEKFDKIVNKIDFFKVLKSKIIQISNDKKSKIIIGIIVSFIAIFISCILFINKNSTSKSIPIIKEDLLIKDDEDPLSDLRRRKTIESDTNSEI